MHNMVKEAFLLIMMVTIAALMYFVLFGSWDNDGFLSEKTFIYEGEDAGVGTTYNGSAKGSNKSWQGVLWYAARVIENPIAFYYYNYCYYYYLSTFQKHNPYNNTYYLFLLCTPHI